MASDGWFERIDRAVAAGRIIEHALALRAENVPASRVVLSLFVVYPRELRLRGRAAEIDGLLARAPAVLDALGAPLALLERSLKERSLGRLILELHDQGWSKGRIVSALMCFSVLLEAHGRDDEAVLAELDRLTGFAPRERQLWPDEPHEVGGS